MIELSNIKLAGANGLLRSISDDPILLSTDIAGTIVIADRISYAPEAGDFQIIGGRPKVWDGTRWLDKEWHANYDPISFRVPANAEVWTVYPGWKAMLNQLIYCHRCFAARVSKDGGMPGWWVTPNHMDRLACSLCGTTISKMSTVGNHTAFVQKARV